MIRVRVHVDAIPGTAAQTGPANARACVTVLPVIALDSARAAMVGIAPYGNAVVTATSRADFADAMPFGTRGFVQRIAVVAAAAIVQIRGGRYAATTAAGHPCRTGALACIAHPAATAVGIGQTLCAAIARCLAIGSRPGAGGIVDALDAAVCRRADRIPLRGAVGVTQALYAEPEGGIAVWCR